MTSNELKAAVGRIFEQGLNKGDVSVFDQLLHPDYVNHDMPVPAPGIAGFNAIIGMFKGAFPDMHVTVEESIAEGNQVATRGYFTGTHKGDFMGIKPTGKSFKVSYTDMWKAEGDKLKENWVQMDMVGLMQQLGVMKP